MFDLETRKRSGIRHIKEQMLRDPKRKIKRIDIRDYKLLNVLKQSETARICLESANKEFGTDLTLDNFTPIEIIFLINKYRRMHANYLVLSRDDGLRILFSTQAGGSNSILLFTPDRCSVMNTLTGYREQDFLEYDGDPKDIDETGVFNWCKEREMYDIAVAEVVRV